MLHHWLHFCLLYFWCLFYWTDHWMFFNEPSSTSKLVFFPKQIALISLAIRHIFFLAVKYDHASFRSLFQLSEIFLEHGCNCTFFVFCKFVNNIFIISFHKSVGVRRRQGKSRCTSWDTCFVTEINSIAGLLWGHWNYSHLLKMELILG